MYTKSSIILYNVHIAGWSTMQGSLKMVFGQLLYFIATWRYRLTDLSAGDGLSCGLTGGRVTRHLLV